MVGTILTIIFSSITSICAIVAPIISLKFQKRYEIKKIQVQEFYKSKLTILEEVMIAYGNFSTEINEENINKLTIALNKGMLVCTKIIRNSFQKSLYYLEKKKYKEVKKYFNEHLMEGLGDEIADSRRSISNEENYNTPI